MEETVTKKDVLVNEFAEKIIYTPAEETSEELFYGSFQSSDYRDIRANLVTLIPVRNLINNALASLPKSIQENFPSNLKKRLKEIGKTVGNPRFAEQFKIAGELRIDYLNKYKWTDNKQACCYLFQDEYLELWEVIRAGFIVRLDEFNEDDICFISEEIVRKQKEPVKKILELWRLPNSQGVIDGKRYLVINNGYSNLNSFVQYFQISAFQLYVSVKCENGDDAVWKCEILLPKLEIFSQCPFELMETKQWETMIGETTNQHASFEEAIKELTGV